MNIIKKLRGYSIFLTGLLYLGASITGLGNWDIILSIAAFFILLQCLPVTTGITRIVGYSLFFTGAAFLIFYDVSIQTWAQAIMQNGNILTLILFVPLMIIPLRFPKYRLSLENSLHNLTNASIDRLYILNHGISHLLGCMVNIACTSIVYTIFTASASEKERSMMARGVVRGYTATMFWSPNSGAVALVLAYWGHCLIDIMPYGIPLVFLTLLAGWLTNRFLDKDYNGENDSVESKSYTLKDYTVQEDRYIKHLIIGALLMIATVIIADIKTEVGILTIVPFVAIVFPAVWALAAGEVPRYANEFNNFLTKTLPAMSNEVVIFLAAGFFAIAAGKTPIGDYLPLLYENIGDNTLLVISCSALIIIGPSLIGIHPVLPTTSILAAIHPGELGLSFPFLALVLLGCWGLAVTISPFSAVNLSVSAMVGKNLLQVGFRWQFFYTVVMFIFFTVYMSLVKLLIM